MTVSKLSQFKPLNTLKEQMGIPRDHYGAFPRTIHKPRAWILLPSGRRLDLLDPQPDAWTDEDLAIGLSRTYRWAGYSKWDNPLSVAQHSLAVLAMREARGPLTAREALREIFHDATEALMGGFDCIATLKPHLGPAFEQLDHRLQAAVDQRYQLPAWTENSYAQHKHADRLAAASEAFHVVGWSLTDMRESLGITLDPLDAEALMRAHIPYVIVGDVGFYQRAEIKDALAFLRLAATPDDRQSDEALRRVINEPRRGYGAKAMEILEAEASFRNISLLSALETADLPPKSRAAGLEFADAIRRISADTSHTLADQLSLLLDATGYRAMLRESKAETTEAGSRILPNSSSSPAPFTPPATSSTMRPWRPAAPARMRPPGSG